MMTPCARVSRSISSPRGVWGAALMLALAGSAAEAATPSRGAAPTPAPGAARAPSLAPALGASSASPRAAADDAAARLRAELAALPVAKYLDAVPASRRVPNPANAAWTIYEFERSTCQCITGTPFHIDAKKKGRSRNLAFVMSGGGACWPGKDACTKEAQHRTSWYDDVAGSPFADWDVVHVPYCDGSVHLGDHDADYDDDGVPDHFHRGLKLTSAGMMVARELQPNPARVLVTGCSAGGYGTLGAYLVARWLFPDADISVLDDSGPGLLNPNNGMKALVAEAWKYETILPKSCTRCGEQPLYLFDWALARDARLRVGLFSSYEDQVISGHYLSMPARDFRALLMSTSGDLRTAHPRRFARYFIQGNSHCISRLDTSVRGVPLLRWIEQLVTADPAWADVLQ